MIHKFYLDNQCSRDFGLLIDTPKVYGSPAADVEYVSVPGRDGDIPISKNRYANYTLAYPAGLKGNVAHKLRLIKAWLNSSRGYRKLWDTYDRDYYRYAAFAADIDPGVTADIANFDITFNCKPFRYRFDGDNEISATGTLNILNPEIFEAKPLITVYGTDGTLTVNNKNIIISAISGYVTIDTETQNAYKGTANKNATINTAAVSLVAGLNTIQASGSITSYKIIPRWRTL